MNHPRILGIGTANPPVRLTQDIGGGQATGEDLPSTPDLTGTVFDTASTIKRAKQGLGNDAWSRRCFYIADDFFTSVSQGAGAYLLFGVIHDWDDRRVIRILQKLPPGYGREGKSATCR